MRGGGWQDDEVFVEENESATRMEFTNNEFEEGGGYRSCVAAESKR